MSYQEKLLGLLSLALRAGKIEIGRDAVERSVATRTAFLVLFAHDAENQSEKFAVKISNQSIPVKRCLLTKAQLGNLFNKKGVAQVAVLDTHFSRGMIDLIDQLPG
jgi:ribosomal protein L7Ae-like RNA K-turn-binding protein